ncbi:hypothetical protein F7725_014759, partial [Dissostichus mawsoni]
MNPSRSAAPSVTDDPAMVDILPERGSGDCFLRAGMSRMKRSAAARSPRPRDSNCPAIGSKQGVFIRNLSMSGGNQHTKGDQKSLSSRISSMVSPCVISPSLLDRLFLVRVRNHLEHVWMGCGSAAVVVGVALSRALWAAPSSAFPQVLKWHTLETAPDLEVV